MSLLDTLDTKITGPQGAGGTSTSPNGIASIDQPETIDSLALDSLAPGADVSLTPVVQSGAGGTGYSWIGTSNSHAGGNGADAGAGILTLSNDTIGSSSAYDPNLFTYYSTAEGGYAGGGGLGSAGGAGGSGGKGGDATNVVSNLFAYLGYTSPNNGTDITLKALAGPGGGGSYGGNGTSAGMGGSGGAGGNAAISISGSTIVTSDRIFGIEASATGGAGGSAAPGGGLSGSGASSGGDGGRGGDASVSMIGDTFSVAGNLNVSLLARTGVGGVGGGSAGASGAAGSAFLDIEDTTFSVAAGSYNALTFTLAEIQGTSNTLSLNGAAGGNLVFSGNHFIGNGAPGDSASELDLAVANGGVAIDTVADTIAIGGSAANNTLSGFTTYRIDSNDSIVMSAGIQVYLPTDPDTVILESGHVGGTVYDAMSGDFILEFKGFTGLTLAQAQLDAKVVGLNTQITIGGQTLTLANYTGGIDAANTEFVPCFLKGTRILTDRGEIPVESLAVGDHALTAGGARRPIVWIGHRRLDVERHRWPLEVSPVLVRKGAFADNAPRRDLRLSPQHAVYVDGALMPIICLANGATIVQERAASVEYYHVELESHDLLLAEGLAAESFLDCDTRAGFANGGAPIELHPTFARKSWDDACAPLRESGPEVEAARTRLVARAEAMGFATTADPDLHVLADGRRIKPVRASGVQLFCLPEGARELKLASRAFRPADFGDADRRRLGVAVSAMTGDGHALDLARLGRSWMELEAEGERVWRWTDGMADLPAGVRWLEVETNAALRYWADAPDENRRAAETG